MYNLPKDHYVQVPWAKDHWPLHDLWPQVYPRIIVTKSHENTSKTQSMWVVTWPLTSSLSRSHVWLYPRIIVSKSHENTSKYVDTVTLFFKNLIQRSLTPRWPLTLHLLRSHMWLYPRIIVSKSHGNTSMYGDTVIKFAKTTYILHTYILRTEWVITLLNTVEARQKIRFVSISPLCFSRGLTILTLYVKQSYINGDF